MFRLALCWVEVLVADACVQHMQLCSPGAISGTSVLFGDFCILKFSTCMEVFPWIISRDKTFAGVIVF